jgi:Ca2+-binding RTX toxin-like protein
MTTPFQTSLRRRTLVALAALAAFGAAHTAAAQASVDVYKTDLGNYFLTAGSENNDLRITYLGNDVMFEDKNTTVTAGAKCVQVTPKAASCPAEPEGGVYAFTGGGNDKLLSQVQETLHADGSQTSKATFTAVYGAATLIGGAGNDILTGGLGDDGIQGRGGADTMTASLGADDLDGGEGDDTFVADPSSDDYVGGAGTDTVDYSARLNAVDVTINNVANDGRAGENDNVHTDVERVLGGANDDDLTGSAGDNLLSGGPGDDKLNGLGGVDRLFGDQDQDQLYGSAGEDTLYGGAGLDRLDGGADPDTLDGQTGPDTLIGGTGNDKLTGGDGTDTVSYQSVTQPVTVDLDGSAFDDGPESEGDTVAADVENVFGGKGDDKLTGNGAANEIQGGPGKDTIVGGAGQDSLLGQEGDDTLDSLDTLADTANCGLGTDKVTADAVDTLIGCEDTGAQNGGGGGNNGGGNNGGGGTQTVPGPVMGLASKAAVKKGKTKVKLACPATATGPCTGTLTLRATLGGTAKKAAKPKAIGSAKFTIAPGKKAQVTIKLSGKAVKALRKSKARKLKTGGTAVATAGASAKSTSTGKVTLTAKR